MPASTCFLIQMRYHNTRLANQQRMLGCSMLPCSCLQGPTATLQAAATWLHAALRQPQLPQPTPCTLAPTYIHSCQQHKHCPVLQASPASAIVQQPPHAPCPGSSTSQPRTHKHGQSSTSSTTPSFSPTSHSAALALPCAPPTCCPQTCARTPPAPAKGSICTTSKLPCAALAPHPTAPPQPRSARTGSLPGASARCAAALRCRSAAAASLSASTAFSPSTMPAARSALGV